MFRHPHPTWRRLGHFHVATASGFVVWWIIANVLQSNGVHYLLAAVLAACCSVVVNVLSNFLWVWRKRALVAPTAK